MSIQSLPSPPFECVVPTTGDLLLYFSARQAAALPSSLWWFCLVPVQWCSSTYLFFLSGLLRPSISGECNSCSAVSQQYHLCWLLLLLYLSVWINRSFSWAFLICVQCVCASACSNSGICHSVPMLSTFQDLLTTLLKGSKISFVSIFPSQLNSVEMY